MVQSLHPTYYYNTEDMRILPLFYHDNNPIFENGLIGCARVTMKRVKNDSCEVHFMFRRQFKRLCYTNYELSVEEKIPLGDMIEWTWTEGLPRDTASWGEFGYYSPGGYSQILFWKSERDSRYLLFQMQREHWISRATRVFIVDILLFNPTINYFCKVRLIAEFPPEGGAVPLQSISTVKLLYPITTNDYITLGMFFVVGVFGVYYAIEEGREILSFLLRYFTYAKHVADFFIVILTLFVFFYIFVKAFYLRGAIGKSIRNTTTRRHISYDDVVFFEALYFKLAGLLLCLCYIKLFCFLHFTRYMSLMNVTITRSIEHVVGYMVFLGIVMVAYAFVAEILFGDTTPYFRTWLTSFFSLYKVILGDFNYLEFEVGDFFVGPIFFALFLFTVYFFLVNMFLAIVNETYIQARHEKDRFGIEHALPYGKIIKRGIFNSFGFLDKPSYANREQERARAALMRVKEALLLNNFSLTEINMFFAKYGIDGKKPILPCDVHRILKDLEQKGHIPMEAPTLEDLHMVKKQGKKAKDTVLIDDDILSTVMNMEWTGLNLKDFKDLMTRLRYVEKQIVKTSRRVAAMADVIDRMDLSFWSNATHKDEQYKNWIPGMTRKRKRQLEDMEIRRKRKDEKVKLAMNKRIL